MRWVLLTPNAGNVTAKKVCDLHETIKTAEERNKAKYSPSWEEL
jgi:hypothetical protein